MQLWELNEAQRAARHQRAEIEILDAAIAQMEQDLEVARAAEGAHLERVSAIRQRQTEIRFGTYPLRSDPAGYPVSGPPADLLTEYERLGREMLGVEEERRRWIEAHTYRASDPAGLPAAKMLTVTDVSMRLRHVRIVRAQFANELQRLEEQLSAGELVQSGVPAPEFTEHRQGVAAARERAGVGG